MTGGVQNNQVANETTFNNAFMKENGDTGTIGKVDLNDADVVSGGAITNLQRNINSIFSYLGAIRNQAVAYLPTWMNNQGFTTTDSVKARADALTAKMHKTTGHTHDNTDGNGSPIASTSIAGVILKGYMVRATDISAPSGLSMVVTTQMSGKVASSGTTVKGVVVTNPYNEVIIRQLSNAGAGDQLLDTLGNEVYGRITESAGVWTLYFYVDLDGIETAYTLTAGQTTNGIRWWYQQLYNPITDAPVYSEAISIPSDNTTQDAIDATGTQRGLISASAQTIGGKKTFNAGAGMNNQNITDVADPLNNQDAATKAHVASALATLSAFNPNKIINGCFRIDQRNVGNAQTISGSAYYLDRWGCFQSNAGTATVQRVASPIDGFEKAMKISCTVADAAVAAGDYLGFHQNIEGLNCTDLDLGKATARNITVSFWVYANHTATYCISLLNSGLTRNYVTNFTITASNTKQKITVTIPGDQSGTWLRDTNIGLVARIGLMSGTTYQKTANQWAAGDVVGTSAISNFMSLNTNVIYFTGFKVEVGSVATPFETDEFGLLVRKCQRYYEKSFDLETLPANAGGAGALPTFTGAIQFAMLTWVAGAMNIGHFVQFKVPKRAQPSVLTAYGDSSARWLYNVLSTFASSNAGMNASAAIGLAPSGENGFRVINNVTTSALIGIQGHYVAIAEI